MPYAVIRTGGKQYRVSPGESLRVESLTGDKGSDFTFSDVLLTVADGAIQVGTPLVSGVTVSARIVEHDKERKILVFKKKRRKNYSRQHGHRQHYTAVQITTINTGG